MRRSPLLVLLALAAVAAGPNTATAADASPRPSDANNQPANATTEPPSGSPPPSPSPPPAPTPAPGGSPPPAPSTPAPPASTTAPPPNNQPPASSSPAPTSSPANATTAAPPSSTPPSTTAGPATPESTPDASASSSTTSTTTQTSSDSSGMGAGAIVGIVLACVGLVGIVGFFAYRHFRARREDAQNAQFDVEYGGASPVLESAHDAKMYASLDLPKPRRQTTATETPTDDIVVMTKYATPSSPKFADNPPQLSPPPSYAHDVADFTKSVNNFDQSRGPAAGAAASTEFAPSYREGSYAESYAESYAGGRSFGGESFMNSFDHGTLGRETFRDTLTDDAAATPDAAATSKPAPSSTTNGLAGLDAGQHNNDSHWMDAMDEMRDTNDSYAMLEAGGSFNSRGSAMRFSNESDIRG